MTGFPSHPCRDALIPVVLAFDCKYSEIVDEKQIIEEKLRYRDFKEEQADADDGDNGSEHGSPSYLLMEQPVGG